MCKTHYRQPGLVLSYSIGNYRILGEKDWASWGRVVQPSLNAAEFNMQKLNFLENQAENGWHRDAF